MLNKIKKIFKKDKKFYQQPAVIIIAILVLAIGASASLKNIKDKNEPEEVIAQKLKKISFVNLDTGNDESFIETIGVIKPEKQIEISANTRGTVQGVYFEVGDNVSVNKLLASLYDSTVLTNLNNAQTNYTNMQNNKSSTKLLSNESIRQAEIGVQSSLERIQSAEIALDSAQDNLENIKALKDKNKIDIKSNATISFNNYRNTVFSALNEINSVLAIEDGSKRTEGLDQTLGVKKISTVHTAEMSYKNAKSKYDTLKQITPTTENIQIYMKDMIDCLSSTGQAINDTLEVIDNTISSADFNETSLNALKQKFIALHSSMLNTQTLAEGTFQALQNIDLSYTQEIINLENAVKSAENGLTIAQTGYVNALAALDNAKKGQDQQIISSQISLDNAQGQLNLAQSQVGDLWIKSPIAGKITKKFVETGTEVNPGQKIAEISQIKNLKIEVSIPSEDIYRIKKDADIIIGDGKIGKITSINPSADPITKKVKIEILFDNQNEELISETFIDVALPVKQLEKTYKESIFIPLHAVSITQNGNFVFILKTNEEQINIAKMVKVNTGKTEGSLIEILDGLDPQDKLIIEGNKMLEDGEQVEIVN